MVEALADTASRVLYVDGDRVPVDADGAPLLFELPANAPNDIAFAGRRAGGAVLVVPVRAADLAEAQTWTTIRELLPQVPADVADMLVVAVSLGRWITSARFCAACGGDTNLTTAGWARRCRSCDREHFPRTDPAVIVAVSDGDRLLLGSNAMWENNRFSCFAGFVEAGETLESAVEREVLEEAGVRVAEVTYVASQAWPFPRSLMLGFQATAHDARTARADGEEILEVRWFTRDEVRAALAGESEYLLPGPASIAHALIAAWVASA